MVGLNFWNRQMSYVETPTFRDILKLQIEGLHSLDQQTLKRLLPFMRKVEIQLKSELNRYGQEQFSYKQRQQTISLINRSIREMEQILMNDFQESGQQYFDFGQDMAQQEISGFNELLNVQTPELQKSAIDQQKFLFNNFKSSLDNYTAKIRQTMADGITMGILARKTGFEIVSGLAKWLDIKRSRLTMIVRTENHRIFNSSKMMSYGDYQKEHFPDMKKALYHPMDDRTAEDSKQLAKLDPIIPISKPFKFTYRRTLKSGKVKLDHRVFMVPPDRPRDRASLMPYRKSWENDA